MSGTRTSTTGSGRQARSTCRRHVRMFSQALLTVNEKIGPANECNSLTLYKAASGALVFDAGTVQWAWGLNNNHDGDQNGPTRPCSRRPSTCLP